MLQVTVFTFNPFAENTYVVSNEKRECIIFDPGMMVSSEEEMLAGHIRNSGLHPVLLINTHCHIDHILGNSYCAAKWGLELQTHRLEEEVLAMGERSALLYGLNFSGSVAPARYLSEEDTVRLGDDEMKILFTPGHSPGSLSFYSARDRFVIAGDVIFRGSIGRTDLPGGDYHTLIGSIQSKLMNLPADTVIYSGHGPATTVGHEKLHNPFLQD